MASPILVTKLYIPPTRPELVPRPRLIERLDEGLNRKFTLISAPAGFGKTTLVAEWLDNLRGDTEAENQNVYRTAWLSIDEGDNDPTGFLTYFIAALNRTKGVEATFGKGALSMLQSPQPPPTEAILTSLINELAEITDTFIFVLDDYHLIDAQPIHDALTFLLEHLPPQMHLVIATRDDPQLPLARLRARGQLTELRARDLRFTSSEAAEFLNQVMDLDLSEGDIAALETRTEGWIAGLQLAAISMQGHQDTTSLIKSFTGSHRFVLDYLIEEVLEQQSESVQTFLLQTAILNRMTGSLCDAVRFGYTETPSSSEGTAVTKQDNGQATLEMLEHSNLFIVPLDEKRHWYRYHHLFSDLLRQRLRQTQQEQLPILHRRASEWYEQNGFGNEAIDHAIRGQNFERVADLVEKYIGGNYDRIDQTTMQRWLAELPEDIICYKPQLCLLQAWNLFTSGQLDAADRSLQVAEKLLTPNTDGAHLSSLDQDQLSDTNRLRLLGRATTLRSFIASCSGDIPGTIQYARQALDYLPEEELEWRSAALITLGDIYASQGQMVAAHQVRSEALLTAKASGDTYILMIANLSLAEILRQQGQLQPVIEICKRHLKIAEDGGMSESAIVGWLFGIWGEVLAELNELDRALDLAKKGVKLAARGRDMITIGFSNLYMVRVLFSSGDMTGAEEVIQIVENTARESDMSYWTLLQLSAWQVRIWLAQGKLEEASRWAGARELDPDGELTYLHEMEYIVLARILIAQGQFDEATTLLLRLLEEAEAGGRTSKVIEILMLQALAFQASDDIDLAMKVLEKALNLAEPGGFIRIFVDEGPPMARLLYETHSRGIASDYVQLLLAAFPNIEPEQAKSSHTKTPKSEWIETLSDRELEVLQLIAEGLTNPEIASRLYLSLNTIKVHTRNIYGKLNVHNRTQAITRSKELGILPRRSV